MAGTRFDGLEQFFISASKELNDFTVEDGFVVGELGQAAVRQTIDTIPSALSPGKIGRNMTGHMRRSVMWDIKQNGNTALVRYGWTGVSGRDKYIGEQEEGSPRVQPGMFALTSAYLATSTYLRNKGYKITRS